VLVYDNADDPRLDIVSFFPRCYKGTIIVTSRNRDLGHLVSAYHLEIGPMREHEALAVLLRSAHRTLPLPKEEHDAAIQLTSELGCLAVALAQVGGYCHQMSSTTAKRTGAFTFEKYLRLFMSHRPTLMRKDAPQSLEHYRRGAYTTLDLSYSALSRVARKFLHLISCFHYSDISLKTFAFAARHRFAVKKDHIDRPAIHESLTEGLDSILCPEGPGIWDELYVYNLIQELCSFSFLSTTVVSDIIFLQIHPLMRGWAQDMLPRPEADLYDQMAARLLASSITNGERIMYQYIVQHIISIQDRVDLLNIRFSDRMAFAEVLGNFGYYERAEAIYKHSATYLEQTRGRNHQSTVLTLSSLAEMYYRQGKWNEAEKLQVEVLEARKKALGDEDTLTFTAMSRLSATYRQLERWDESEQLQVRALNHSRAVLGSDHPYTLSFATQLASIYRHQGQWEKAANLEVSVLEINMRTMGPDHLDTINAQFNLGTTLYY